MSYSEIWTMCSKHRHHFEIKFFENLESLCHYFKRTRNLIAYNLLLNCNLRTLNDNVCDLQLLGELDNSQANPMARYVCV